jgi:hypothetical protein
MVAIKSRKGRKSSWNQRWFKALKVVQIIAGALIAFFASFREGALRYVTGIFGVVVVILESLQGLYEFQHYWIQYRTISEGLKREKYLWLAKDRPVRFCGASRRAPGRAGRSIAFSGTCRLGGAPGTDCLGRAFGVNPHRQWNSGRPGPAGATVRQGRELTTLASFGDKKAAFLTIRMQTLRDGWAQKKVGKSLESVQTIAPGPSRNAGGR